MKKRLNRAAALLTAGILLAGAVAGCGRQMQEGIIIAGSADGGKEKEDTTEITFFGYKADALNLVVIENALHGFMEEHENITVTYEGIKGMDYWQAFELREHAGMLEDVVMVDHDHAMMLEEKAGLLDLSSLSTVDAFTPQAKAQFTGEDGSVPFLPLSMSAYGMYVNEDLLQEHGQEVPQNLVEFMKVCDYFVQQGITPVIANNYSSLRSLMVARGLYSLYQAEDLPERIARYNAGKEDIARELASGVALAAEMIERGFLDAGEVAVTTQTEGDIQLFVQGERPFMLTGAWASPRVAAMEPGFHYSIYPYPVLDNGCVLVQDVNTCVGVNAAGGHLKEAVELVEYLTQPDILWDYCDSQSCYAPIIGERMPKDETIAPLAEYQTNGQSVIGSDYNLLLPMDTALNETGERLLEGLSAEDAIALLSGLLAVKE